MSTTTTTRVCSRADCEKEARNCCSRCESKWYCSESCQKKDWPQHKTACHKAVKSVGGMSAKQLKEVLRQHSTTLPRVKANRLMCEADKADKAALVTMVEKEIPSDKVMGYFEKAQASIDEQSKKNAARMAAMSRNSNTVNSGGRQYKMQQGNAAQATPEQLKQQAAMMRKDPGLFRRMVPDMKDFTDAQIRDYADQMEKMAADPDMFAQMQKMGSMDTSSRDLLMGIQSRVTGDKPVDAEWIQEIVSAFKAQPDTFKTLMKTQATAGGVDAESFDSYFDFFAGLSEATLVLIAHAIWWLASAVKPGMKIYNTVDSYTFGSARYLVLAIVMVFLYYAGMIFLWFIRHLSTVVVNGVVAIKFLAGKASGSVDPNAVVETIVDAAGATAGDGFETL